MLLYYKLWSQFLIYQPSLDLSKAVFLFYRKSDRICLWAWCALKHWIYGTKLNQPHVQWTYRRDPSDPTCLLKQNKVMHVQWSLASLLGHLKIWPEKLGHFPRSEMLEILKECIKTKCGKCQLKSINSDYFFK